MCTWCFCINVWLFSYNKYILLTVNCERITINTIRYRYNASSKFIYPRKLGFKCIRALFQTHFQRCLFICAFSSFRLPFFLPFVSLFRLQLISHNITIGILITFFICTHSNVISGMQKSDSDIISKDIPRIQIQMELNVYYYDTEHKSSGNI